MTKFQFNDGGRAEAGFSGRAADCVCRSIAIVTGLPYKEVYKRLASGNASQRITKNSSKRKAGVMTASMGINTNRKWFKEYMKELGFDWVPTMKLGTGCKVHLRSDELPSGRLVVSVSRHFTALIDGVIHDTHDPTRYGNRCVYGYYVLKAQNKIHE